MWKGLGCLDLESLELVSLLHTWQATPGSPPWDVDNRHHDHSSRRQGEAEIGCLRATYFSSILRAVLVHIGRASND